MFTKARLKLTGWYAGTIMLVSLVFSTVIYQVWGREISRFEHMQRVRIEGRLQGVVVRVPMSVESPELIEETKRRVLTALGLLNAGIGVAAVGLGYVLAGRTLGPIAAMVAEQNRFVSDASHELKTPITSLKTACEVYLRSKKNTLIEAKKLANESLEEVERMRRLSESLLQLARFENPNHGEEKSDVLLRQTAREAAVRLAAAAKKKRVKIVFWGEEVKVKGVKQGLVDLAVILLDNAVKYSHAGGKVEVWTGRVDGAAVLRVKDNGIGIAEKDLPRIFDRFFRADTARSRSDAGGYGLGLSIAKKIAEAHQGIIGVDSQEGGGSVFSVTFQRGGRGEYDY